MMTLSSTAVCLLLGLFPVALGQDLPAHPVDTQQVSTGREHPSRERILVLDDGTTLRGRTRCQGGNWELHGKEGW